MAMVRHRRQQRRRPRQQLRCGPPEQDAGAAGPAGAAEKLLRGIQKKLRQCEALQERREKGEALTGPELEKLGKVPGWCALAHCSALLN